MTGEFTIAIHALVFLYHKDSTVSSEALAKNICTNPARVRKVMAKLKKAGLVATREGLTGGYRLTGDASAITLRTIADILEERFAAITWHSGDSDMDCLIASGMAGIMDAISGELDTCCRDKLSTITIRDINDRLFG